MEGMTNFKSLDHSTLDCEYTLTRLETNVAYYFRVAAENKAGMGEFSDGSDALSAVKQPGKAKKSTVLSIFVI